MTVASQHKVTSPRRRLNADVAAGAITVLLGALFSVAAAQVPSSEFGNAVLQPRDLPLACGLGMTVFGAVLTAQGIVRARRQQAFDAQDDRETTTDDGDDVTSDDGSFGPKDSPRNLLVIAGLVVLYALTFIPLGYVVATFVFLMAGTMYFAPNKLRRNVTFALVFSLGVYLAFTRVLGIVLPQGLLEGVL